MTLMEGRNRQIRKMMGALGFTVVKLHRTQFMNINIDRGGLRRRQTSESSSTTGKQKFDDEILSYGLLRPGDWAFLDQDEMSLVENALVSSMLQENS